MSPTGRGAQRISIPTGSGWGIVLAVGAALISGLAVYLNAFAVKQLPDAAVYTTLKNGVAAAILVVGAVAIGGRQDLRAMDRRRWASVLVVAIVGGSVPFVLFFTGLAAASAPSAAFIQKTLFVWVALLAVPFLGETLGFATLAALFVMVVGQALVLPPQGIVWGRGETLILAATVLWALETILARRLLASLPGHVLGALRMGLGLVILIGYLLVADKIEAVGRLSAAQWAWAILTGTILAGYVATWYGALKRAPASVVTSVLVLGAVVTGGLTTLTGANAPSPAVITGYLLIVAAAVLIILLSRSAARTVASASLEMEPADARPG
jgi:drug/metabolite transporter (DMT)-like permease